MPDFSGAEKRLGYRFSVNDVYLNVIGGLKADEPAADLAVATALISSIKDEPVASDLIAIGEIGLAGEVRAVQHCAQRVKEAIRLGFRRVIIPQKNYDEKMNAPGVTIIPVKSIFDQIQGPAPGPRKSRILTSSDEAPATSNIERRGTASERCTAMIFVTVAQISFGCIVGKAEYYLLS